MKHFSLLDDRLRVTVVGKAGESRGNLYPVAADAPNYSAGVDAACTAIELLVVAHACAGVQVDSVEYQDGLRKTLDIIFDSEQIAEQHIENQNSKKGRQT